MTNMITTEVRSTVFDVYKIDTEGMYNKEGNKGYDQETLSTVPIVYITLTRRN